MAGPSAFCNRIPFAGFDPTWNAGTQSHKGDGCDSIFKIACAAQMSSQITDKCSQNAN